MLNILDPDYCCWRVWAASLRDASHLNSDVKTTAGSLCRIMDVHQAFSVQRDRPIQILISLQKSIVLLIQGLLNKGIDPPTFNGFE